MHVANARVRPTHCPILVTSTFPAAYRCFFKKRRSSIVSLIGIEGWLLLGLGGENAITVTGDVFGQRGERVIILACITTHHCVLGFPMACGNLGFAGGLPWLASLAACAEMHVAVNSNFLSTAYFFYFIKYRIFTLFFQMIGLWILYKYCIQYFIL